MFNWDIKSPTDHRIHIASYQDEGTIKCEQLVTMSELGDQQSIQWSHDLWWQFG